MQMNRLKVCDEICQLVHIDRHNPKLTWLSKREMTAVFIALVTQQHRISQLERELDHVLRDRRA